MACAASGYQMMSDDSSCDFKGKIRRGRKGSTKKSSSDDDKENLRVPEPGQKRIRGRPRGNPTPLNNTEKRLRNAQYERERRIDMADAMTDLGNVFLELKGNVDNSTTNAQLLEIVVQYLKEANETPKEDIHDLARINHELEAQIAEAEMRLGYVDMSQAGPSWHTPQTCQRPEM